MSRVIAAFAQYFDGDGSPLANGFLRFTVSGTNNTNKNTYSDSAQTLANANPLQLDAEGRCPNVFGQGNYRVTLYNYNAVTKAPGDQIAQFDPVSAEFTDAGSGDNFQEWSITTNYQVGNIVTHNGKYYTSITANNLGNDPETNPDQWEQIGFVSYWNQYATYSEDDLAVYNGQIYASLADSNLNNPPDTSPTWWTAPGAGTILLQWEESGTTFQPKATLTQDLGSTTNVIDVAWIQNLGGFTQTPSSAPPLDYSIANKKYADDTAALKMAWQGEWTPGTYSENDVVRDDNWTMIANTSTDERPAPQPVGDSEWVRDQFSPPAFLDSSVNEPVLYVGQRYTFVPAFLANNLRVWFPISAIGLNVEVWAVYNPTGSYRVVNLFPGFQIDDNTVDKWVELPFGQIYVENNTIIDILMVFRSPAAEQNFTYQWDYIRANGDPLPGDIHHQSGGNADQIRIHEQDTSLVDRTTYLDNVGPGSTIYMAASGYTWEVLLASKTGDVYTYIVDPGARAGAATSNFTFTYFGNSPINYSYNTNLFASDARIQGFFSDEYDPNDAASLNEDGYGIDIELQQVIASDDWEVVAQPASGSAIGGGSSLGYWAESEEHWEPKTNNVGFLGDTDKLIQGLYLGDSSPANFGAGQDMTIQHDGTDGEINLVTGGLDIATTGSEIITFNSALLYSANNGPLAGFRNKIINGNFDLWQRGTNQSAADNGYGCIDRWYNFYSGATRTVSQSAFTVGQTDIPGEPKFYLSTDITASGAASSDAVILQQRIFDVRTLAGQAVALSFYAKANTAINIATEFLQTFGSGSSTSAVAGIGVTTHALTTSWQKFTLTASIPSISGADIQSDNHSLRLYFIFSAGSDYDSQSNSLGLQIGTFDIAQVQLEPGIYVTPFEQRPESIEKSLCKYFFNRLIADTDRLPFAAGRITGVATAVVSFLFQNEMRDRPAITFSSATGFDIGDGGGSTQSVTATVFDWTKQGADIELGATLTNVTGGTNARLRTGEYIDFNSEL